MDWFLCGSGLRHERIKVDVVLNFSDSYKKLVRICSFKRFPNIQSSVAMHDIYLPYSWDI